MRSREVSYEARNAQMCTAIIPLSLQSIRKQNSFEVVQGLQKQRGTMDLLVDIALVKPSVILDCSWVLESLLRISR